jgi:hypothetical protein
VKPSVVISCHQAGISPTIDWTIPVVISGHQWSSVVISGPQADH